MPVDPYGRVVIWPSDDTHTAKTLPTDSYGKEIHQIVGPGRILLLHNNGILLDNQLLSTDSTGRYLNSQKEPIPVDDFGRPLSKQGDVLPTNENGQYIAEIDVLPTSQSGRPVVVVGPDSVPLGRLIFICFIS